MTRAAHTPTARELLAQFRYYNEATGTALGHELTHEANCALATRVEKVLAYCETEDGGEERESLAKMILRLLNGEQA